MNLRVAVIVNAFWFRTVFLAVLAFVAAIGMVNGQDSDAKIISAPEFKLSAEAEVVGIDGSVEVVATITKDGSVKSAHIAAGLSWPCGTSPTKELDDVRQAIGENVSAFKFQPAMKNGKAKEVDVSMVFAIGKAYRNVQEQREMEKAIASGQPVPKTVKGGVLNGRALSLPKPIYPLEAKANKLKGSATIQILIDESGKVIQAGGVSGFDVFQRESRIAACAARFSPTLLDGKPVKVSGVIVYNFIP